MNRRCSLIGAAVLMALLLLLLVGAGVVAKEFPDDYPFGPTSVTRDEQGLLPHRQEVSSSTGASVTLNLNLSGEPLSLDPALASDTMSHSVIEQLFIGLVDLDDETFEVQPELATSWTVSPDGTVYTFTLRSDATWSDGKQVTAQDVRYGILRTLDPDTASDYAYVLSFVIKNAEAYNTGAITDTDQVGVTAVDTTTLRVTLEHPASYALSIFSMWIARPMPQWAIEAYGVPTWTEPANIVTNGAYRLTEWVHDDHILLDKNPTFYDATNVQIERVRMWMTDPITAWQMYLDGQLDTAGVPSGTSLDPVVRQEVHIQPIACTYYYGFNISQAPFDNLLVRKAFSAATNRRGLVNDVLNGTPQPALTFTPPGVFGHVDGYAEGVGIPYNPTQAQQWLAQAGYPNGQGLPPITLWYNTSVGHQNIAEYVRDTWYNTLGVSVTLQSMDWSDYLDELNNGEFQVWRLGWCLDYPDAHNFLSSVYHHQGAHGNWSNATYDDLLDQAAQEQDPEVRKALYKQAEEILVETDAVRLPLYYYTSIVATKPYLERTYSGGAFDIATWRITRVSEVIDTGGGDVTSYDGNTNVQIPAGAITDTVVITQSPASGMPPGGNLAGIDHVFDITTVYSDTGQSAYIAPGHTCTVTVQYTDTEKGPVVEDTLGLYWWDEGVSQWSQQGITSSVNITDNLVTAQVDHFSIFAVLGETHRVYLPLVLRSY
jgi:oligopeptide transport system substrate-binding protein